MVCEYWIQNFTAGNCISKEALYARPCSQSTFVKISKLFGSEVCYEFDVIANAGPADPIWILVCFTCQRTMLRPNVLIWLNLFHIKFPTAASISDTDRIPYIQHQACS